MSTSNAETGTDKLAALRNAGPTILAIVVVLGVIFTLFEQYRTSRLNDLQKLYAGSVAHVGRQAELKLESFAEVVNNLRPDAYKRALNSEALLQALAAKNRLELATKANRAAEDRHADISSIHASAKQQKALAEQLQDQLKREAQHTSRQTKQLHLEVEQALENVLEAQQLEGEALERADTASVAAQTKVEAAQEAALYAERAAKGLRALEEAALVGSSSADEQSSGVKAVQQAADAAEQQTAAGAEKKPVTRETSAENPTLKAPVAPAADQTEGKQGDPASPAAEATSALERAREDSRRAQDAAIKSANEARTANDEATRLIEAARVASGRARELERAFNKKFNELVVQLKSEASSDAKVQRVADEYARRAVELHTATLELNRADDDSEQQREVLTESLSRAGSADVAAGALQKRALAGALPSYHNDLMQCLRAEQVEDAGTCLMRASARMKGLDPRIFQFTPCPNYVQGDEADAVWLNESKGSLVYVLDRTLSGATACIQVPVSELLPKTARDRAAGAEPPLGELDEVLLVAPTGNVLRSRQGSAIRIDRLPRFDPKATASSMVANTELGAQKFREFRQPILVPIAPPCTEKGGCGAAANDRASGLMVAGFVDEGRLARESTRFRPSSFLWVALALASLLLALPLLKLFLVQATSRYDRFDCALLGTGATLATFVVTLALWSYFANQRLHQDLETRLEAANTTVRQTLETHLDHAARLLVRISEESASLTEDLAKQHTQESPKRSRLENLCAGADKPAFVGGTTAWLGFDKAEAPWVVCERVNYPREGKKELGDKADFKVPWKQFIYMNQQGFQLAKFSPDPHASVPVDSDNRAAFHRALKNQSGCLRAPARNAASKQAGGDANCDALSATVDVVRTATSGEVTLVVARQASTKKQALHGVTALATGVEPLTDLLLPRGVAMAVVDSKGKVLLHSDNDAQHGHSVFDDVDDALALRALLNSRASREINLRYQGEPVRFAISYLPGPDWHVITMGSRNLADVALMDAVAITLAGTGLFLLAEFSLVGVYLWRRVAERRRRTDHESCTWFRPQAHLSRRYAWTAFWVIVITVLGVVSRMLVPGLPLLVTLLILLGASAAGLWLPHAAPGAKEQTVEPNGTKTFTSRWLGWPAFGGTSGLSERYCAWLFSLSVAGIVVPTSIWFTAAYDHVSDGIVRADQAFYAHALQYKRDCFGKFGGSDRCPVVAHTKGTHAEPVSSEQQQAHMLAHEAAAAVVPLCLASPLLCVVRYLPTLGSTQFCEGRLHEASLADDTSHERDWVREHDELQMFLHNESGLQRLSSRIPNLVDAEGRGWTWVFFVAGALVVGSVGFLVSKASLKRQLFLPLLVRLQREPDIVQLALDHSRLLLRGVPSDDAAALLEAKPLSEYPAQGQAMSADDRVLIRDLLGTLADEAQRTRLKDVIAGPARIVAFSPGPVLEARALRDEENLRREWIGLLKGFHEGDAPVHIDSNLTRDVLPSKAYMHLLWHDLPDSQQRVLAQLVTEGFFTPDLENEEVLEYLVRRGILSQDTLAMCNRHFAEFVQSQVSEADMSKWEGGGGQWERLRAPLYTAAAALTATAFASAPEVTMTGALAPAVAAGLPALLRILTSLALRPG